MRYSSPKSATRRSTNHQLSSSPPSAPSPPSISVFAAMTGHPNGAPPSPVKKEEEVFEVEPLRTLAPMLPTPFGYNTITIPSSNPPYVYITPSNIFTAAAPPPLPQQFANPVPLNNANGAARINEDDTCANGDLHTPNSCKRHGKTLAAVSEGDNTATPDTKTRKRKSKPREVSGNEVAGGSEAEGSKAKKKSKQYKRIVIDHEDILALPSASYDARESVEAILMTFDALRRRLTQLDEVEAKGLTRCPHYKANTTMKNRDLRANAVKRIGHVPGVEVGDMFYFRTEMSLIGLHHQGIAGIDYAIVRFADAEDHVALSIVSAGGYENADKEVDFLIYSGQGGSTGNKSHKKPMVDQKLEKGNLALERSLHRGNEIRVIRSEKDFSLVHGKIYIYDGIYKISQSWVEKGKTGFNLFKYKLLREPGQPDGIAVWKMTQKWIEDPSSRGKFILPDMSSSMENIPVCLVNDVDDEKGPSHFTYAAKINYSTPEGSKKSLQACTCYDVCVPSNTNCSCAQMNGGILPYSSNGILVSRKPLIYECGGSCPCTANCRNRVTQKGVRLHFEVFRTRDRGWGLRSWDPIRAGTFICEYIGEVIDKIKVDEDGEEDEYIFHTMHADDVSLNWNYGPELHEDPATVESIESFKPLPIILSAKRIGNVSRFMNHSCSPNAFWQPILHDHGDAGYPHIMFFAIKHIPPMTEITYDYGTSRDATGTKEMGNGVGFRNPKKCLCGSSKCRDFFG